MLHANRRYHLCTGLLVLLIGAVGCARSALAGEVYDFTRQPVHLAYADWQGSVKQEGGATQIRAAGRGGVLAATSLDLSADQNAVLALTLKIAETNQASTLQVRFVDAAGGQGAWDFPIAGLPKGKSITVSAAGNAPLAKPARGRGKLNLKRYDATLAAGYEESARKAMTWAEADFARQCKEKGKTAADLKWTVRDFRNLAAVEMLRLTGDRHWHEVFMENTVLTKDDPTVYAHGKAIQSDAAFAYAIADEKLTDPVTRKRAVQGLERQAKVAIAYANGNAFDILSQDKWRPMFMGFYSTPMDGRVVLRAYHLTHKPEYLAAGVRACQFSSGANPENLVETTGLGANPILHPLRVDPRMSGQPVPEGLTVYGIEDHVNFPSTFCYWILPALNAVMSPEYLKWPVAESYVDTYCFVMVNEFTTDIWDQSVWTWGYLAARP